MVDVVYQLCGLGDQNGRIEVKLHVLEGRNWLSFICYDPSDNAKNKILVNSDLDELKQLTQLATFAARKARASSAQYIYYSDDKAAKQLYDQACELLNKSATEFAIAKFGELIERYPSNAWADRASERLDEIKDRI